jgi:hypothetical protein
MHSDRVHEQDPLHARAVSMPADHWHGPTPLPDPAAFLDGLRDLEERVFKSQPPLLYLEPRRWLEALRSYRSDYLFRAAGAVARLLRQQGVDARYFVFGHNHDAEVRPLAGGGWYYNTGTWTIIAGEQDRFFREAREFTYVQIVPGAATGAQLLRWNDEANRGERVILMTRSPEMRSGRKLWGLALLAGGLALLVMFLRKRARRRRQGAAT